MSLRLVRGVLNNKVVPWLDERIYLSSFQKFLRNKLVPNHKHTVWYLFGGLTLFFFIVQVATGVLLLLYYKPTPETAYESVKHIITEVPYGNLVRSVHVWSAHFMIGAVGVHMFTVYFMKAYRKPREAMWLSGFVLLMLTLGFGFTGYLLPWDTTAFFATQIGTEIPRSIPLVGEAIVLLLRGGTEVNSETLTRLFALHVVVLPLAALLIVAFHLVLNQLHGTSKPIGVSEKGKPIPFLPTYLRRDWLTWLFSAAVLIVAALTISWGLGTKADPFGSAPAGIRPEWYFWFLYQTLKFVPSRVLSMSGEFIVDILVSLACLVWWLIPFFDRNASREKASPLFTALGIVILCYLVTMTIWAGLSG
jgi:cytochrome b6